MCVAKLKSRMRTCCAVGGVAKRQYAPMCTPSRSALRTFHIPIPLKAAFTGFEREKRHGAYHNSAKLRFTCKAVQTKREAETFFSSCSSKRHVKNTRIFDGFNVSADLALMHLLFLTSSAGASTLGDGTVVYDAEKGSETLKTLGGTAYIVLVVIYVLWVLKKRADRARNEKIASTAAGVKDLDVISDLETEGDGDSILKSSPNTAATMSTSDKVTPAQCFIGFAQAGVICYLLYLLSTATDSFFASRELPTQYTARNIAILIQTVVRGLAYLITFIFGANAIGLASLGVALIVAPDWVESENGRSMAVRKGQPDLPKVKVTDDIFAIRRAFKEAEEMGRNHKIDK